MTTNFTNPCKVSAFKRKQNSSSYFFILCSPFSYYITYISDPLKHDEATYTTIYACGNIRPTHCHCWCQEELCQDGPKRPPHEYGENQLMVLFMFLGSNYRFMEIPHDGYFILKEGDFLMGYWSSWGVGELPRLESGDKFDWL